MSTDQILQPVIIMQNNDFDSVDCKEHTSLDHDGQIFEYICDLDLINHQEPSIDIHQHKNNDELPSINVVKEIFTLPLEYLPTKKRAKIEKSGKSKLPSVGTSDAWYEHQLEKENIKKIKEEKQKNRKRLQDEKKKLMDQEPSIDIHEDKNNNELPSINVDKILYSKDL
ncbi:hypothetical protein PV327_010123 [Microctonus hyperodae]|uniref:Uncharacterized protein n=1 Tax=Microctonus hyperodae TaxID=165561 RepID=A0AA39KUK9_MICHY|nr:hypothetical protein PV327_010123 [Microctonus hyperodae]